MRITGGIPVGGNFFGLAATNNPLMDPRFKIQGGEPWNKKPLLPGKDTENYENRQFNFPAQQPMLSAGVGNVNGMLLAQSPGSLGGIPPEFADELNRMEQQSRDNYINRFTGGPAPGTLDAFADQLNKMEEQSRQDQYKRFITPTATPYTRTVY